MKLEKMFKVLFIALLLGVNYCFATSWSSNTIEVNNHQLHYYEAGSGKAVYLLTGYATTSNFWSKPFVNCLAKDYKVVLVDYYGINSNIKNDSNSSIRAMAADSFALSQALKSKHPVFIGWSMGGAVAQQIAFDDADAEIKQVVLISPLTVDNQPTMPSDVDSSEIIAPLRTYNDILNYVFYNNLYDYSPKQLSYYKNNLFKPKDKLFPGGKVSANQSIAMNAWANDPNTLENVKKSKVSFLFMVPLQDKILLPNMTTAYSKKFMHAKLVEFDGSGHNIAMQAPEQVCKQIKQFID
ncbi:MAG: alpha/beta hydrolase [Burkholderiales bacterium]|nr:alpha/beta hydrolase [Burkholderiales bacterium]